VLKVPPKEEFSFSAFIGKNLYEIKFLNSNE
jgi:hypothetical protein